MTLDPCINLSFDGHCEAAFRFYERCLNGRISFLLTWADSPMARDAERLFAELAEGGVVRVPLQKTFWAHSFGVLTDRFGIHPR